MAAAWVFLPALGSPAAHAPMLRWDLLTTLKRPISRRLCGENKTWRGALVMTAGPVAAAMALDRVPAWRMRPAEAAQVAALVTAIHVPINLIGYAVGARTAPL